MENLGSASLKFLVPLLFRDEAMSFSPPRIPKDSPSYLIWSIFTKEREERRKQEQSRNKKRTKSADRSPMSRLKTNNQNNFNNPQHLNNQNFQFEAMLLEAKMTELQKEIENYQKENAVLSSGLYHTL